MSVLLKADKPYTFLCEQLDSEFLLYSELRSFRCSSTMETGLLSMNAVVIEVLIQLRLLIRQGVLDIVVANVVILRDCPIRGSSGHPVVEFGLATLGLHPVQQ